MRMARTLSRGFALGILGVSISSGAAQAQAPATTRTAETVQPQQTRTAPRPADSARAGDLPGPIDNLGDLQDTGKMIFKLADTNNDNLISKKEATDFGNLAVGGFFFRADTNGDGTISKEEAKAARDSLLAQKPLLRTVIQRVKAAKPGSAEANPFSALANLLDTNQDKNLQASEVRQAVSTSVDSFYQIADTNRDNQMSPAEVNAAMIGIARSAARSAMQAADADHDGSLSLAEYDKAITGPSHVLFEVIDANNDGKISEEEAQAAIRVLTAQLRMLKVPEPANSASNLLGTGVRPEQAAPVPNFGTVKPNSGTQGQPTAPARELPR